MPTNDVIIALLPLHEVVKERDNLLLATEEINAGLYKQTDKQYIKELNSMKDGFSKEILDELCRVLKKICPRCFYLIGRVSYTKVNALVRNLL